MAATKTLLGTDLTAWTADQRYELGSKYESHDGNEYIYAKLLNATATVAAAANTVLAWSAADGRSTFEVVSDNTDADTKPIGAGVTQGAAAGVAGTAEYGWLLTKGPFTDATGLAGTPVDGDALFLSTTDLTLTLSTAADDPVCAYANDASADLCVAAFN